MSIVRDAGALTAEAGTAPRSARPVIVSGVLGILNPKVTTFFFAFLPRFVDSGRFAAAMRNRILSRPRVLVRMRRVFAGGFAAPALKPARTEA